MRRLNIDQNNPDDQQLAEAAAIIKAGGTAVFPTDTVYGLGAAIYDPGAVERIFAIKRRSPGKGLIAMVADEVQVEEVCRHVPEIARALMARFWPGQLTLVLPAGDSIPELVAVNGSIGVRMPHNQLVRQLIQAVGQPLATTSANLSGRPSAQSAGQAERSIEGQADLLIDGGRCAVGIESTVLDLTEPTPKVLRDGAVSKEALWEVVGRE